MRKKKKDAQKRGREATAQLAVLEMPSESEKHAEKCLSERKMKD